MDVTVSRAEKQVHTCKVKGHMGNAGQLRAMQMPVTVTTSDRVILCCVQQHVGTLRTGRSWLISTATAGKAAVASGLRKHASVATRMCALAGLAAAQCTAAGEVQMLNRGYSDSWP